MPLLPCLLIHAAAITADVFIDYVIDAVISIAVTAGYF